MTPWHVHTFALRQSLFKRFRISTVLPGSSPITDPLHLPKHARSQGPLLRRHYPASTLVRPCPTPARPAVPSTTSELRSPTKAGLPRLPASPFRRAVPTTPADRTGAHVDYFPAHAAFPKWQEGRHPHCHFRGLLRLHSYYGPPDRSAAQGDPPPPRGQAFVTRLQPGRLPDQAARQLPDLSTTIRVEPSSTGDPRLRGALPKGDIHRS